MDDSDRQKRCEAGPETLPTDDQLAVLPLQPRERPLSLEAWHGDFDRATAQLLCFPTHVWGSALRCPGGEVADGGFCMIVFVCDNDLRSSVRASTLVRPQADGVQPRDDLLTLVAFDGVVW